MTNLEDFISRIKPYEMEEFDRYRVYDNIYGDTYVERDGGKVKLDHNSVKNILLAVKQLKEKK